MLMKDELPDDDAMDEMYESGEDEIVWVWESEDRD